MPPDDIRYISECDDGDRINPFSFGIDIEMLCSSLIMKYLSFKCKWNYRVILFSLSSPSFFLYPVPLVDCVAVYRNRMRYVVWCSGMFQRHINEIGIVCEVVKSQRILMSLDRVDCYHFWSVIYQSRVCFIWFCVLVRFMIYLYFK